MTFKIKLFLYVTALFFLTSPMIFSQDNEDEIIAGYEYFDIKVTKDSTIQNFLKTIGSVAFVYKDVNFNVLKGIQKKVDSVKNLNPYLSNDEIDKILGVTRYIKKITVNYDEFGNPTNFYFSGNETPISFSDTSTIKYLFTKAEKSNPIIDVSNKTNFGTVYTKGLVEVSDAFNKKGSIQPVSLSDVFPTNNFVNPYLSAFGWEPLGIPQFCKSLSFCIRLGAAWNSAKIFRRSWTYIPIRYTLYWSNGNRLYFNIF